MLVGLELLENRNRNKMGKENPRFKSGDAIRTQLITDGLKVVAYTGVLTTGVSAYEGDRVATVVGAVLLVGSSLVISYRTGRRSRSGR